MATYLFWFIHRNILNAVEPDEDVPESSKQKTAGFPADFSLAQYFDQVKTLVILAGALPFPTH